MEIEFSPNQIPVTRATSLTKPAPAKPSSAADAPSLQGVADLQSKLNQMALTRPDKMDAARSALADVQYPPDELLNGIAHLLAIRLTQ